MAEILEHDVLGNYHKLHKALYQDLLDDKLTYVEAHERYKLMCDAIPVEFMINSFELNLLMKERFGNTPEWKSNNKVYKIDVGKMPPGEEEEYIKKIMKHFKKQ